MPAFERAEITDTADDLSDYKSFLRSLQVGQVVTLPLTADKSSRGVVRRLNAVAEQNKMRLTRLPAAAGAVRFKVAPAEKRAVSLTEEQKRARTEKARATRAARLATASPKADVQASPTPEPPPVTDQPTGLAEPPNVEAAPAPRRRTRRAAAIEAA